MKKLIIVAAIMAAAVGVRAQGTVSLNNRVTTTVPPIDAPVLNVNGSPLSGAGFQAALYGGASADSLALVGAAVPFRTGTRAGYTDISNPDRTITGVAGGGFAFVQIRAWDASTGATWETATSRGQSNTIRVKTGGDTAGGTQPPTLPANLIGLDGPLAGFSLQVPEPATVALGLIGFGALMLRRRK